MLGSTNACACDRAFCRVQLNFWKFLVANLELVWYISYLRAIGTVVARYLHTVDVAGSNPASPISRLTFLCNQSCFTNETARP